MVGCGDNSESTPASPEDSAEIPPITQIDSVDTTEHHSMDTTEHYSVDTTDHHSVDTTTYDLEDTTEYSCHDSKKVPKVNFDERIMKYPQLIAMRKAPYMAYRAFHPTLMDIVRQHNFESDNYGWYPDSTPFCLIEMVDSISNYTTYQWFHETDSLSTDSIATEIECSNGSVYLKEDYAIYEETLKAYNETKKLYNQLYDSLYEASLHEVKILLDSCLNYPETFPINDPNYEERYQWYQKSRDN